MRFGVAYVRCSLGVEATFVARTAPPLCWIYALL